jgi:multidrug efflux pump subunit AcrB
VLRPLSLTLSIALLASYLVSVTVIPILAPFILRLGGRTERWGWEKALDRLVTGRLMHAVQELFVGAVRYALGRRAPFVVAALVLLVVSGRGLVPIIGRDLMPPMDTGIFRVSFEAWPNTSLEAAEAILSRAEEAVWRRKGVVRSSATLGSEPGVLTFGSGRNPQQAFLTVHLVDRFERAESLWDVEQAVLSELRAIPGIRFPAVYDYGATPLSTVRATVDLMISGPDPAVLDGIAREVERRLQGAGGLTATLRTWSLDRAEHRFLPDTGRLAIHGIDAAGVASQVAAQVKGVPATPFRVPQQDAVPVWVQAPAGRRDSVEALGTLPVRTARGTVPLSALGSIAVVGCADCATRERSTPAIGSTARGRPSRSRARRRSRSRARATS